MTDLAAPNLPSRDFELTAAFYGAFGFAPAFRDESWMVLRLGVIQLEFFPFPDLVPEESSFRCSIRLDDLDALYRRIRDAGVAEKDTGHPRLVAARRQPWGQRVAFLVDPDGTQLQLIENGES